MGACKSKKKMKEPNTKKYPLDQKQAISSFPLNNQKLQQQEGLIQSEIQNFQREEFTKIKTPVNVKILVNQNNSSEIGIQNIEPVSSTGIQINSPSIQLNPKLTVSHLERINNQMNQQFLEQIPYAKEKKNGLTLNEATKINEQLDNNKYFQQQLQNSFNNYQKQDSLLKLEEQIQMLPNIDSEGNMELPVSQNINENQESQQINSIGVLESRQINLEHQLLILKDLNFNGNQINHFY